MRRISLALALLGAAAAGCGGGKSSDQGGARGVAEGTFTITIQNGQNQVRDAATGVLPLEMLHGRVTSSPTGINCAAGSLTGCDAEFDNTGSVVLTAAADTGFIFLGWAGDCASDLRADGTLDPTCTLAGKADKYVLARFGTTTDLRGHPNRSDPTVHGPLYWGVVAAERAGTLGSVIWNCFACHGSALQGSGLAVSCQNCHSTGMAGVGMHEAATGHNSGTCARCHSGDGFRDYVGADGSADNHLAGFLSPTFASAAATNVTAACSATVTTNCLTGGIRCETCHNPTTALGGGSLQTILFAQASGAGRQVTTNGVVAICGQCHTGQRDGYNVAQLGIKIATTGDDVQIPTTATGGNAVVRAHFLPAAATLLGEDAGAWYQYSGAVYTGRNQHGGLDACSDCHDPHDGALPADAKIQARCGSCHLNEAGASVSSFLELEESRQLGFEGDIDGDGDATESLKSEIDGLAAKTYQAIQAYATNVAGNGICAFDNRAYILADTTVACGTAPNNVAYNTFTPRLLRAFFNYLMYQNDAGVWAHNPRYVIEILYDTTANLNLAIVADATAPIGAPVANGFRAFDGHFGGAPKGYATMLYHGGTSPTGELIPTMGFTSGACYQCHGGAGGVAAYLAAAPAALTSAVMTDANKVTALECSTCHALDGADMRGLRTDITTLYFPPQKVPTATPSPGVVTITDLPATIAVCGTCHSGRENGQSITNKIAATAGAGDLVFNLGPTNPHYLGAAGIIMGADAGVLYQYAGQTYAGKAFFWNAANNGAAPGPHGSPHGAECSGCHQPKASRHGFEVDLAYCGTCHQGPYALAPVEEEVLAAEAETLTAIRAYATANLAAIRTAVVAYYTTGAGSAPSTSCNPACVATKLANASAMTNVCYDNAYNAYWFVETAGGCQSSAAASSGVGTAFAHFDAKMAKAAFNYQWSQKDPGAWAHNEPYVMQALYDSIVDLGGTPSFAR